MNTTTTDITIRLIEPHDNAGIAAIIRSVLSEFNAAKPGTVYYDPTTDDLFSLFKKEDSAYFIAEVNGQMAGGCGVYPTAGLPEGCCELVKLYLLPEARRLGLGKQLIETNVVAAGNFAIQACILNRCPS